MAEGFDWNEHRKTLSDIDKELARAKKFYRALEGVQEDLMARAKAASDVMSDPQGHIDGMVQRAQALEARIGTLEGQISELTQARDQAIVDRDRAIEEASVDQAATVAALERDQVETIESMKSMHEASVKAMTENLEAARDHHTGEMARLDREIEEKRELLAGLESRLAEHVQLVGQIRLGGN